MTLILRRRRSSDASNSSGKKSETDLIDLISDHVVEEERPPNQSEFEKLRDYWDDMHKRLSLIFQKLRDREQSMNDFAKKEVRSSNESGSVPPPARGRQNKQKQRDAMEKQLHKQMLVDPEWVSLNEQRI